MKLLFSFADVPTWAWIASAAVIAVAIIIIVCIAVWAHKKSKAKTGKAKSDVKAVKEETAASSATVAEEEPVSKPVQKKEEVKVAETKAAEPEKEEPKPAPAAPARDSGKVYHISKRKTDGKWQIKLEGGAKAIKLFDTQAEAIAYGKVLSENQDARFVLHKLDGSFRKLTY